MSKHGKTTKSLLGITTIGLFFLTSVGVGAVSNASKVSDSSRSAQSPNTMEVAVARVNTAAPNFTGVDSNGKTHNLSDFKGKVVVLEWSNHECPFVRKHYGSGNMQKLQKEATGKGVVWLTVLSSAAGQQGYVSASQANELSKSRNASPTAVILDPDGKIGKLYGARTTPHMFVIGADGNMKYMGAIDSIASANAADVAKADNYVRNAVNALVAGKQVTRATTQPYGCTVKYGS